MLIQYLQHQMLRNINGLFIPLCCGKRIFTNQYNSLFRPKPHQVLNKLLRSIWYFASCCQPDIFENYHALQHFPQGIAILSRTIRIHKAVQTRYVRLLFVTKKIQYMLKSLFPVCILSIQFRSFSSYLSADMNPLSKSPVLHQDSLMQYIDSVYIFLTFIFKVHIF